MWQSKESKLKAKDKKVYGFTKNQRCKGMLLDPQGMVQKLSYRITLRGQCQPNCILRVAERERERDEKYLIKVNGEVRETHTCACKATQDHVSLTLGKDHGVGGGTV